MSALYPIGIQNVGNSCFLNAVLQSLASVRSFHLYLLNNDDGEKAKPLTTALRQSLQRLSLVRRSTDPPLRPLIPSSLIHLSSLRHHFNRRQQDAQELFVDLMKVLGEETSAHVDEDSESIEALTRLNAQRNARRSGGDTEGVSQGWRLDSFEEEATSAFAAASVSPSHVLSSSSDSIPPTSPTLLSYLSSGCRARPLTTSCSAPYASLAAPMSIAAPPASTPIPIAISRQTLPSSASSSLSSDSESEVGCEELQRELSELLHEMEKPYHSASASPRHLRRPTPPPPPVPMSRDLPFSGMLESRIECTECHHVKLNYESFLDLQLTLPKPKRGSQFRCSLADCLEEFTAPSLMPGVECEWCDGGEFSGSFSPFPCSLPRTDHIQRFSIGRAPKALLINFRRQLFNGVANVKSDRFVHFPTRLSLASFCSAPSSSSSRGTHASLAYRLMSVVVHSGGAAGGHFSAYRRLWGNEPIQRSSDYLSALSKGPPTHRSLAELMEGSGVTTSFDGRFPADDANAQWVYVSDEMVREATEDEVLGAQAYILVYEREGTV